MNIYIIGPSGTGKSYLCRLLKNALRVNLIDTDACIESKVGLSISDIFLRHGKEYFRSVEKSLLKDLAQLDRVDGDNIQNNHRVVSTGGGMVIDKENRQLMRSSGIVVCIIDSPIRVYSRIKSSEKVRPLLDGDNLLENIQGQMLNRIDCYLDSDLVLSRSDLSNTDFIDTVLGCINEKSSGGRSACKD